MGEYLDSDPDENDNGLTCKYCGVDGFEWQKHDGKWRLGKDGVVHVCDMYQTKKTETQAGINTECLDKPVTNELIHYAGDAEILVGALQKIIRKSRSDAPYRELINIAKKALASYYNREEQ